MDNMPAENKSEKSVNSKHRLLSNELIFSLANVNWTFFYWFFEFLLHRHRVISPSERIEPKFFISKLKIEQSSERSRPKTLLPRCSKQLIAPQTARCY